jgi:O-antigen/teichoic acid export membrane protein
LGYGSKLLASCLLNTIYGNIYPIIIGKLFSAADLGQYTRASSFAGLPSQSLTNILQRVSFPVLSQIQKEENRLAGSYRRMLRFTAFIVFPVMIGMAALAHPFVIVLVTNKWAQCVPYLQIICLSSMWYPIHVINLNLLQVKGRSDLFLKLEIAKKAIATIAIFASVPFGIIGICIGGVCTSIICLVINTYYTGKLINIGFLKQMRDLTPILLLSLTMGLLVYFSTLFFSNEMVKLLFGIIIGIVFYLFCSWIFGLPELKEAINILKRR